MTKSIFLTLSGRTNAGKSTLLNALVGEKIASVCRKPQTTRTRITGILTKGETQFVFIDTPGLHKPGTKLNSRMMKTAETCAEDADTLLYVLDGTHPLHEQDETMLQSAADRGVPCLILVTKTDLLPDKTVLMPLMQTLEERYHPYAIIPVCAPRGEGLEEVLAEAEKLAAPSVHFFPDDAVTDQPERVLAAEMIREKLLRHLNDEVPHGIAVVVERMKEREDRELLDISAVIFCEKPSHKGIIIGKNGAMLKKIAASARRELEKFFQIQVNLQCYVKVRENWRNQEAEIRRFGLADE